MKNQSNSQIQTNKQSGLSLQTVDISQKKDVIDQTIVKCIQGSQSIQFCFNQKCKDKSPFTCSNIKCPCNMAHKKCPKANIQMAIQSIKQKIQDCTVLKKAVDDITQKAITKISELRQNLLQVIDNKLKYASLHEIQIQFYKMFFNQQKPESFTGQSLSLLWQQINEQSRNQTNKIIQVNRQLQFFKKQIDENCQSLSKRISQITENNDDTEQIPNKLQKIIKNMSLQEIQTSIKTQDLYKSIYIKLKEKQINQIKEQLENKIDLASDSDGLSFDGTQVQVDYGQLVKTKFKHVGTFRCQKITIGSQQLKSLILNINRIFPKLKMLVFRNCQLKDSHWKIIVDNIDKLAHIQLFSVEQNHIQNIKIEELQKFLQLKQLKFFIMQSNKLTQQSKKAFQKFKQNNQQIIRIV